MKNKNNFNLVLVIAIFIVGCAGPKSQVQVSAAEKKSSDNINKIEIKSDDTKNAVISDAPKIEDKHSTGGVTMEKFNKLKTGMAYDEVVKILGKEGEIWVQSQLPPCRYIEYKWNGKTPRSSMKAMFKCGKLISKSQIGLK